MLTLPPTIFDDLHKLMRGELAALVGTSMRRMSARSAVLTGLGR
jgi:hypothetical protein